MKENFLVFVFNSTQIYPRAFNFYFPYFVSFLPNPNQTDHFFLTELDQDGVLQLPTATMSRKTPEASRKGSNNVHTAEEEESAAAQPKVACTNLPLTLESLHQLNGDQRFSKAMFPSVFWAKSYKAKCQARIEWATKWLQYRSDREAYPIDTESRSFGNLGIHDAFNKLSNDQLQLWLKHQEERKTWSKSEKESGKAKTKATTETGTTLPLPLTGEILHQLNRDQHFTKNMFPKVFWTKNYQAKCQARIDWTTEWLHYRSDREEYPIDTESRSFGELGIQDAFNKLSNDQLQLWLKHQEEKKTRSKSERENGKAATKATTETGINLPLPLTGEILHQLNRDQHFTSDMFPKVFWAEGKASASCRYQARIDWATEWLPYRSDRKKSESKKFKELGIKDAFNKLSNSQLQLWLNHQQTLSIEESEKETTPSPNNSTTHLKSADLNKLSPDQEFTELMFPPVFQRRGKRKEDATCQIIRTKANIEWTETWLRLRRDRDDASLNTESKHFPEIPINLAFNILSNRQLRLWLNTQKQILFEWGLLQENCQQLEISDLDKLPPDQWFTIFMFPPIFTSSSNTSELYQAKIEWTTHWLQRRAEKDDFDVNTDTQHLHDLPIHFTFNVLSNKQLQMWLNNQLEPKKRGEALKDHTLRGSKVVPATENTVTEVLKEPTTSKLFANAVGKEVELRSRGYKEREEREATRPEQNTTTEEDVPLTERDRMQHSSLRQEQTERVFSFEEDLLSIESDRVFTKRMLPKVFWFRGSENAHRRYQARIDWTTKWLQRRKDRTDAIIDKESKPFHKIPIVEALNTLSNRQLHRWLMHQKDFFLQMGPSRENCQELTLADLDKLPPDYKFTVFMFPDILRSRENVPERSQSKIDWASKWLERRKDREDFEIKIDSQQFHDLPIGKAFNYLSNCQLHLWINLHRGAKSKLEKALADVPLTKQALSSLDENHEFTKGMFPRGFYYSKQTESPECALKRYQAKVEWTQIWLLRRHDRKDHAVDTKSKYFHDLPIQSAFNLLSNKQLLLWLDNQRNMKKAAEIKQ